MKITISDIIFICAILLSSAAAIAIIAAMPNGL